MSIGTRLKTAAVGLPIVVLAIRTVTGTALLLLLVLMAALLEYEVSTCARAYMLFGGS
jgi:hypothetical protein